MNADISSKFWTDEKIENLTPEQKLAILWLITNPARDICGFTQVTSRRFMFETGLPMEALQRSCEALPRAFKALPGNVYFSTKFLRYQCGNGETIKPQNNVVKGAIRWASRLPEALRRAFSEAYPELSESIIAYLPSDEKTPSPSEGLVRGKGNGKGNEDLVEERSGEEIPATSGLSPVDIVGLYPRRQSVQEAITHVTRAIGRGTDPQTIADGTRAIAAVIRQMPSGHLNAYVPSAAAFFEKRRWEDDPQTWLRNSGAPGSNGGRPENLSLGGRKGTTIKLG